MYWSKDPVEPNPYKLVERRILMQPRDDHLNQVGHYHIAWFILTFIDPIIIKPGLYWPSLTLLSYSLVYINIHLPHNHMTGFILTFIDLHRPHFFIWYIYSILYFYNNFHQLYACYIDNDELNHQYTDTCLRYTIDHY